MGILDRLKGSKSTPIGLLETAANMGTGAVAELGGGLAYLGALPFGGDAAAQAVKQSVQNAYTYQPRSQSAQQVQGVIGNLVRPIAEPLAGMNKAAGDATYSATGSPLLSAIATAAPQAGMELLDRANLGGLKRAPNRMGAYEVDVNKYGMEHRPPRPSTDASSAPFHQLDMTYPDDVYSANAYRYYGSGNAAHDREVFRIANKIRGNPDAEVEIYRAVPKENFDAPINPGDWVTATRAYADQHGQSLGDYAVLSKKVKAKELWTNADSLNEFGWWPSE